MADPQICFLGPCDHHSVHSDQERLTLMGQAAYLYPQVFSGTGHSHRFLEETKALVEEVGLKEFETSGMSEINVHHVSDSLDGASQSLSTGMKILDLCIYLRDRTVIHITLDDGHLATAEDLFQIVVEEQKLPPEIQEIFSLWLVSPLLGATAVCLLRFDLSIIRSFKAELRLKKHHRPYNLVQQWDNLCAMYTNAKLEDIQKDEPILMFQRHVFYQKKQECQIENEQILCLLYHEAKYNVLEGRYTLETSDYDQLAGIQILIHHGLFNSDEKKSNPAIYRNLEEFYPDFMCKKQWKIPGCSKSSRNASEFTLEAEHRQISREFTERDVVHLLPTLYQRYLQVCRNYPFYGSAFFNAQVERPFGMLHYLLGYQEPLVWIAINTEGLCVIEKDKNLAVLAVAFTEMAWEYHEEETVPTIFVQFVVKEEGHVVTKLLDIHSKQAKLMDALIESCVRRILSGKESSGDDGCDTVDGAASKNSFKKICNKLKRLNLATYSTKGERIS